jgi:O-antigen ligase/Flp pilus assembly protein TadD
MGTRSGTVALAAVLPLTALIVDPAGWFPFGPGKWLVVSTLVPAGAALVLRKGAVRVSRGVTLAAVALVGWMAVSAVVGRDGLYAWAGTPERHFGVLTWLLCLAALVAGQNLDLARDRVALAWGAVIAGLGTGGFAVSEALGWEPSVFAITTGRLTATMGSAAYLGALAILLLPISLAIAFEQTFTRRLRGAAALSVPALAVALIGSQARAAWLGAVTAAVVVAVARRTTLFRDRRRTAIVSGGLVLGVVALVTLSPVGARVSATTDSTLGGASRLDEWRVAARVIAKHPITGVGPEGYRIAFAEGVDDAYEQAYGRDPLPDRAHSGPLDVAATGGLPALMAWCVVIGLMLRAALRGLRSAQPFCVGVSAALVAYFAGQLLLFPIAELEPVAWLLAGVVLAATRPGAPAVSPRWLRRPAMAALGAIAVVGLVAGVVDVVADRHAAAAASAHDPATAVREASAAVDLRPDEVRLHLLLAYAMVADDRSTADALEAIGDGLHISHDDPIARRQSVQLLVQRAAATHLPGDIAAARTQASALVARDPHNAALWLIAGAAARLAADAAGAETAFLRAEYLSPHRAAPSTELALLYLDLGRGPDARAAAERAVAREPSDARAQQVRQLTLDAG